MQIDLDVYQSHPLVPGIVRPRHVMPKSIMIVLGKPNRCKMSQMKSTSLSDDIFVIGLYSIHLVNLSTATRI